MAYKPSIYAELLPNIRQISLAVELPSPTDSSTRLAITSDGDIVHLTHRGEICNFILPAKTSFAGKLLPIQKPGSHTLTWRLPLDPRASLPASASQQDVRPAPWTATDLQIGSEVACRRCKSVVVSHGAIKAWKDLPSENWAEMMEFWHCHKPGDHHGHGHHDHDHGTSNQPSQRPIEYNNGKADEASLALRGYGASSVISAQDGVGFVDLTTFLFSESDCSAVTVSPMENRYSWANS